MRVFLDASILVAVVNKEYPLFNQAGRLLSLVADKRFSLCTSAVCLAIAFYFASKKHGETAAKRKIAILIDHLDIAACGKKEALLAAGNPKVLDFEDGLEYYAAQQAGCSCIVTEDGGDFFFSEMEVLDTESFLKKYALKRTY